TFADQAAIAVANARLMDAVERQLEQQRAVADVLETVARAEGLDAVFDAVVDAAVRLCDAEYGALYLEAAGAFPVVAAGGPATLLGAYERDNPLRPGRETLVGRVALLRDVVHIPDVLEDAEYTHPRVGEIGLRTLAGAPIFVEDELIGVVA